MLVVQSASLAGNTFSKKKKLYTETLNNENTRSLIFPNLFLAGGVAV